MKAVCHLDRVGRALPTTFGVRTGAIADDDLEFAPAHVITTDHVACPALPSGKPSATLVDESLRLVTILRTVFAPVDPLIVADEARPAAGPTLTGGPQLPAHRGKYLTASCMR